MADLFPRALLSTLTMQTINIKVKKGEGRRVFSVFFPMPPEVTCMRCIATYFYGNYGCLFRHVTLFILSSYVQGADDKLGQTLRTHLKQ